MIMIISLFEEIYNWIAEVS